MERTSSRPTARKTHSPAQNGHLGCVPLATRKTVILPEELFFDKRTPDSSIPGHALVASYESPVQDSEPSQIIRIGTIHHLSPAGHSSLGQLHIIEKQADGPGKDSCQA